MTAPDRRLQQRRIKHPVEAKLCCECRVNVAMAGVYCQPCLDRETEGMGIDELF